MSGDIARDAVGDYQYGFHDPENATIRFDKGLSEQVVIDISELKNEPKWMTDIRVKAYRRFMEMPMPTWGNCDMLNQIDFDAVTYFLRSSDKTEKDWDEVPDDIKNTFDRLGFQKPNKNGLAASQHNTNQKQCIIRLERTWKNKAFCSSIWIRD